MKTALLLLGLSAAALASSVAATAGADDETQKVPTPRPMITRPIVMPHIQPVGPKPARPRVVPVRPKPPPPPAAPAPEVRLTLETPTLHGAWTLHVLNDGPAPVMLAADARLLSLEVTARGERKPVRCELPADMRPADDMDRALVLPPGRSYTETFQPRLYCFGEHGLDAMSPGAIVVARLGWPAGTRAPTHQVVWPIDGVDPVVSPLPGITSLPVALPDEPTPVAPPVAQPPAGSVEPVSLRIAGPRAVDAPTFGTLSVTVTLHNDGSRPVRLRFRPEDLAFDIVSAKGAEHCSWPTPPAAPMRDLFSTLPPGGAESLSVLVEAYCRRHSFDKPGLVVLRPVLDTRKAGGEAIGLATFDGQVIATTPTVIRLHQGTGKLALVRPQLDHAAPETATADTPK